jgi:hypothetical protein
MITAKFSYPDTAFDSEKYSFKTYKEFFKFYTDYSLKGTIFDVKDDNNTK